MSYAVIDKSTFNGTVFDELEEATEHADRLAAVRSDENSLLIVKLVGEVEPARP